MIGSETGSAWEADRCARTWAAAREARVHARSLYARSVLLREKLVEARHELDEALANQSEILRSVASRPRADNHRAGDETPSPHGIRPVRPGALYLDDADLEIFTDDVITAYRTAVQRCDDDATLIFANILRKIGRHLAVQVGPKAAGVLLN